MKCTWDEFGKSQQSGNVTGQVIFVGNINTVADMAAAMEALKSRVVDLQYLNRIDEETALTLDAALDYESLIEPS